MTFDDLPRRVDALLEQKNDIHRAISDRTRAKTPKHPEYFDEDCIEIAAAVKACIRETGMSRHALVDEINRHYGWPTTDQVEKMEERPEGHLSLHMFNHYLSKPTEYRMPAGLLFAICRVTGSLYPCQVIAADAGGDVVTHAEKSELLLGKAEKAVYELNRLKRQIKSGR